MRITVVSPHLPTPALPMRGVRRSEQLVLFARSGHAVRGVVPLSWTPWRARIADESVEADDGTSVPVFHPYYLRPPWALSGAGRLLERYTFSATAARSLADPDVVLVHSAMLPGGLLGRTGRAPLVVTMHDHELHEFAAQNVLVRGMLTRTLRSADAVVYVSEALRREGVAVAGPHHAHVIPIGIETCTGVTAAFPEHFTISCVARLAPRKGIDRVLRAFARLAPEWPGARVIVIGDGPERSQLEHLARELGILHRVEFTGALDFPASMQVRACSTVMALPAVRESLGAAYLETMSLGIPVLATRGEGIAPYIEHGVTGILVGPDDDDALYGELRALAADPARARRIGEAGRRRFFAGNFGWQANVDAHLRLFAELRHGRRERGATRA